MPIRRGPVSFARFKLVGALPKDPKRWLTTALRRGAFEVLDPKSDQERAAGFVELEQPEQTDFGAGSLFQGLHALFAWRVDTLRIPGAQVRAALQRWAQAFEREQGRPPGRREKAEQKDAVRRSLRGTVEPVSRTFEVSLDLTNKDLFLWATSRTVVEEVQAALESGLSVKLVARVPAAFVPAAQLDALQPTAALLGEGA